jgi:hypothetical protein
MTSKGKSWIPAFAGMTSRNKGGMTSPTAVESPASAEMTSKKSKGMREESRFTIDRAKNDRRVMDASGTATKNNEQPDIPTT